MTTTFWCWAEPRGRLESKQKRSRSNAPVVNFAAEFHSRSAAYSAGKFQLRMSIRKSAFAFSSALRNEPSSSGKPSSAWPGRPDKAGLAVDVPADDIDMVCREKQSRAQGGEIGGRVVQDGQPPRLAPFPGTVSPGRRMDELRSSRHLGALKKRTRDRGPALAPP